MNLAFLLHIYQPPIQERDVLKKITDVSYIPLFKIMKNLLTAKFTFNIPLSLIYQWHLHGYDSLISNIKQLYEKDRIELTSCGAFHPLLAKLPEHLIEKEIILNEYALGYYFGQDKGFEGEDALLLKNVSGFFPPEMAVNDSVIDKLEELGYSWFIADEVAIPKGFVKKPYNPVFDIPGKNIKLVTRNTTLSNNLAFTRDTNVDNFIDEVLLHRQEGINAIVALDGEFFGHHYDEGLDLLEKLINKLEALGIRLTTVSELVDQSPSQEIEHVVESTWAAGPDDIASGNSYPMWDIKDNEVQGLLWKLFDTVIDYHRDIGDLPKNLDEVENKSLETFPIWDLDALNKLSNQEVKNHLYKTILLLQSVNSDQFWWASGIKIGGRPMFREDMITNALEVYELLAGLSQDEKFQTQVKEQSDEIKEHVRVKMALL